jgi:hypothetical protein
MRLTLVFAILLSCILGALTLSGCGGAARSDDDPSLGPRVGSVCTVYLRRDALGAAASTPIPATSMNHNGADIVVRGKLVRANAAWVEIDTGQSQFNIPREAILMLEFRSP